jgi:HAD superfamily hydrolase (TIGR01549 family)
MAKALIFDVDGTLVDTVDLHARAWVEAFRRFGRHVALHDMRRQIGRGADQLIPVFLPDEEVKRIGEDLDEWHGRLYRQRYMPTARAFPMVREVFEMAKRSGQKTALASSGKREELERYKRLAQIEDLVDVETSSDDADRSKPFPDIFAAVLRKLVPIQPADAIVIGDTPYDAEAAGKLGLRTIGLRCGCFTGEELRQAGCVAIYDDVADLLKHYYESPAGPDR